MKFVDRLLDAAIARRIRKSVEPLGGWKPKQIACWDCKVSHALPSDLSQALASAEGFFSRHLGHQVNWFEQPGLAGLWIPNADVKEAYAPAGSVAYTITLASLATSATLVAGRESTAVSNTALLFSDYLVGGKITVGTTPTIDKTIEVWLYGSVDDTPTYPDVFDGTDSDETVTSVNVKKSAIRLLERMFVDATTDRAYWFGPVGIQQAFGGRLPKNHGIFVTHDTAVNLNSTGGNHVISYTGVFNTVI